MKKLFGFLLAVAIATTAFGQLRLENMFRDYLGAITPSSYDRVLYFDASGSRASNTMVGYVLWSDIVSGLGNDLLMTGRATVDTNTVVANASAATQSISLLSGDLFTLVGLYGESGWDNSDFIELNNADSNATTLDTINILSGWRSHNWQFFCTQDTVIYLNLGDTVTVASGVEAYLIWTINR